MTRTTQKNLLTPRQRDALQAMRILYAENPGPVGPTALAARMGISKVRAHELIQDLVRSGQVLAFHRRSRLVYVPVGRSDLIARAIELLKKHGEYDVAESLAKETV